MLQRFHPWALLSVCLGGFLLAGWYRFEQLAHAQVYSDSLSPFAAAVKANQTGWANPSNPEGDHWSWIAALPLIWSAQTLEGLFALRFWVGALLVGIRREE